MDEQTIGSRLKCAREKKGLKQSDVCNGLDIQNTQTLSAYERDKNAPPCEILKKLAKLYGVSTDWILFGEKYTQEKTLFDYLEQLIESVDALQLDLCSTTIASDPFNAHDAMCIVLNSHIYPSLDGFAKEWQNLRMLRDNDTIDADDYETLLNKRINRIYGPLADDFFR